MPAVLIAASFGAVPALAEAPAIDLPAGALRDAVAALSTQAGISVAVPDRRLWQRPVRAVRGRMSAAEALRRLLQGSSARALPAGPRGWRIVASTPPTVSPARPAASPRAPVAAEPVADVVVTASKRDMRLESYPGTVTIIDAARLSWTGREGTDAILAQAATVSSTHLGSGRNKLFIRGIADSSFTGPTQATVGQYWGDVRLTYNAPDPDLRLYDIASVEVLEGPHGALYGAGSLGGIVRVVRNRPNLDAVQGWAELGASATWHGAPGADGAGLLNFPIADRAAVRLLGYAATDGGYVDNPLRGESDVNRTRVWGGRGTVRVDPAAGWSVEVGLTAQDTHGRDSQYADRDAPRLTRASRVDQGFAARYLLGELVVQGELGDLKLTSSTGVVRQHLTERYDASLPDGPERLFRQRNETNMVVNETRLSRPMRDGLGWVVGASLLHNRTRLDRSLGAPNGPMPTTGVVNTVDEQTLFGEASLAVLRDLTVTAGARVSHAGLGGGGENVLPAIARAGADVTARRDETAFLPSLALSAVPLDRLTVFARFQQGFRPGGLAIESDFVRRFRNDRVSALEAGLRYGARGQTPFDLALSASRTRWRDIQADFIDGGGLPSTANIGDGRIHSFSAAVGWMPTHGLRLEAGAAVNDSKVTEPDRQLFALLPVGRLAQIPNIAGIVVRGSADYETSLPGGRTLAVSASARYVGSSRLGVGPVLGAKQGDYLDTRLAARLGFERFGLSLSVTNLTDEVGNRFALGTPFQIGRAEQITPLRPRTIRLGIDTAF